MKKNKKTAIAYLHTHFDPEWYRSADSFNVRLVEIIDKVLDEINSSKLSSFYFDGQILALLNYLKFRPEKEKIIKKLIKEKKIFIGPFFVSADTLIVPAVALIKNLETGLNFSKKFKETSFIGYMSDTFGHSNDIFKVLKYFNINNAIIWRGVNKNVPADFKKEEINTTRLVMGYYQDFLHTGEIDKNKAQTVEKILDKINQKSDNILLLPIGGDHLAPVSNFSSKISLLNKYLEKYEIIQGSPFDYIEKAKYIKNVDEEFLDNSETYILQGVYSTRIDEKIKNAKLCFELYNKIFPLNYFLKGKFKNELEAASIELLYNQAHDSIYGCSSDSVSKAVKKRQESVSDITKTVRGNLIRDFKKEFLINNSTDKIGVFNFSNYSQNGCIKIISDKKIKNAQKIRTFYSVSEDIMSDININPMTEDFHDFYEYLIEIPDIKPFSFKNFKIPPVQKAHIVGNDFIENGNLKLFILDNKINVTDKKTGELFEDFINLHSTKDTGDSYNYAPLGRERILKLLSSKIKTKGKIKSTLEIKFEDNIKLNVSLTNKSDNFEFEIHIKNRKKNRKLQIVFNTKNNIETTLSKDLIAEIKRTPDYNYLLSQNMPVADRSELKTGAYPNNGYVLANDVLVAGIGLNEYEIYKNSLKITFLRSIGIISNPKNPARFVPAGPPIKCPDMWMIGEYKIKLFMKFDRNNDKFQRQKFLENVLNPFLGMFGDFKIKNKTFIKNNEKSYFVGIINSKPLFLN